MLEEETMTKVHAPAPISIIAELVDSCGGCAVIDGGLAVQLQHHGAHLRNSLWTATCLISNPEIVRQVHTEYLEAGAHIILTSSYQATIQGFQSQGYTVAQGEEFLTKSVSLALEARDRFWKECQSLSKEKKTRALVAASIGSYGAYLADNSEASGDYGSAVNLDTLKEFHRRRIVVLAEAGPDLLAMETIPSKLEAQALVEVLEEEDIKVPAWVAFNSTDGENIVRGDSFKECVALVERSSKVVAVGINCSPPSIISGMIRLAREVTAKPVLVYPNRGGLWDAVEKEWIPSKGATDDDFVRYAGEWKKAGASLIGGCCQTTPATVRAIAGAIYLDGC